MGMASRQSALLCLPLGRLREPSRNHQRLNDVLRFTRVGALLILSFAAAACGDGNTSPGETIAPPRTAYDASDVWLQFGDYVLGAVPDMFVTGPEIVVYSDGVVFAQVRGSVIDRRIPYDMATGRLTQDEMRQLATATKALPVPQPLSDTPVDAFALPLTSGGRTWQVPDTATHRAARLLRGGHLPTPHRPLLARRLRLSELTPRVADLRVV